jgi:hypothetical protein
MKSTHLAAFPFPFKLEDLRTPAFRRRPELVSLEAAPNLDKDPDFASRARTAGNPMDPRGAVLSLF